jgi:hypothetical protein
MNKKNQIEDEIQGENLQDKELYVVISPLEEIISNMPMIGKIYSKSLYKKYQKIFPEYYIILK